MSLFSAATVLAFGLTFAFGAGLRLLGGEPRGRYLVEACVAIGFTLGWYWTVEERVLPYDPLSLTPVIALSGAFVGVILNMTKVSRLWAALVYAMLALISVLGLLTMQADVSPLEFDVGGASGLALWLVLSGLWLIVLARFDLLAQRVGVLPWILVISTVSLSALAVIGQEPRLALAATLLAAALFAHAVSYKWLAGGLGDGLILTAGLTLTGLVTALALRVPVLVPALGMICLVFFAPASANAVSARLPKRAQSVLRQPVLIVVSAIPAALAVLSGWLLMAGPWGR